MLAERQYVQIMGDITHKRYSRSRQILQAGAPCACSLPLPAGKLPASRTKLALEAFTGICQGKTNIKLKLGRCWACAASYFPLSKEGALLSHRRERQQALRALLFFPFEF